MSQEQVTPQASDDAVMLIDDLNSFVHILTLWHAEKVALTEHLLELPDGAKFQIGEDEPITLTGEMLDGFKLGVQLSLMQLGTLPFAAEVEDTADTEEEEGTPA